MKKYEIPEINISLFDAAVSTLEESATRQAINALNEETGLTKVDSAQWGTDDWTIMF